MKPVKLFLSSLLAAALLLLALPGTASADTVCTSVDVCPGQTVQTPLGPVTVTADPTNAVTVRFIPTDPIRIIGIPSDPIIPGNPVVPGNPVRLFRTTVDTTGGAVTITTVQRPQLPGLGAPLNLAIVSIHPPSPCRETVSGTTVVFTPLIPPGPPA